MNGGFVAEKKTNRMNLKSYNRADSGVPKAKPLCKAKEDVKLNPLPNLRFPKRNQFSSSNTDFKKCHQTNAFIDSYYPKLDVSEEASTKSHSSNDYKCDTESSNSAISPVTNKAQKAKASARTTFRKISEHSFDSKTYTLSFDSTDNDQYNNGEGDKCESVNGLTLGEEKNLKDCASAVECFYQLYSRIEILEELLQQTLEKSTQLNCCNCTEKCVTNQKSISKFSVPKNSHSSRVLTSSGCDEKPKVNELPKKKETSDTDIEIQNLKKRLKALERKLKKTKTSRTVHWHEPDSVNKEVENCTKSKDVEESDVNLSENKVTTIDKSTADGLNSVQIDTNEEKPKKDKKRIITKLKNKCSGMISSKIKNSKSDICQHDETVPQEPNNTKKSLEKLALSSSLSNPIALPLDETGSSLNIVAYETPKGCKPRKKIKKKRKDLCKKFSITNFLGDGSRKQLCKERNIWPRNLYTTPPFPMWMLQLPKCCSHNPCDECFNHRKLKKRKTCRKRPTLRCPIDVLKRGGKIKVPVLFEEMCNNSEELRHKVSNISMRFVMVKKDSKHPLRKLIRKLSKIQNEKEQYIFGVSKCYKCDSESTICHEVR